MKYAFALAMASLLLSGSVRAEQAMVVKVRDLNLHTTAGAAVALQRMNDAAAAFCAPLAQRGERDGVREMDVTTLKCRRDLAVRAAIKLGAPEVRYLQSLQGPTSVLSEQAAGAPWRFSAEAR